VSAITCLHSSDAGNSILKLHRVKPRPEGIEIDIDGSVLSETFRSQRVMYVLRSAEVTLIVDLASIGSPTVPACRQLTRPTKGRLNLCIGFGIGIETITPIRERSYKDSRRDDPVSVDETVGKNIVSIGPDTSRCRYAPINVNVGKTPV
jgi:hypothetical protein